MKNLYEIRFYYTGFSKNSAEKLQCNDELHGKSA